MHKRAQELAIEMDEWCKENFNHEITLTACKTTFEEDKELNRQSDTHRTGRAFDIRVIDMPEDLIAKFCSYFRKKYPSLGAYSKNAYQLIVYRPHGSGPHFHVQLKRDYSVKEKYD